LYTVVKNGMWRELNGDQSGKSPAVSYARFQGQEELMKHFSSSVVMHEQDPKKRPIFRHKNAHKENEKEQDNGATDGGNPTTPAHSASASPTLQATPVTEIPPKVDMLPRAPPVPDTAKLFTVGEEAPGDSDLKNVLENGAKEIAALLMRATANKEVMAQSHKLASEDNNGEHVVDSQSMGA